MKYLQKLDTTYANYLTYDYVASLGNYDKRDDSFNNGVAIKDEPLNQNATLFYTSTYNHMGGILTFYNDLSTLDSTVTGVPYSNIRMSFRLKDDDGNTLQPYSFKYVDPDDNSKYFEIRYYIPCSFSQIHIYDSLTFPNNILEFNFYFGEGSNHPFARSHYLYVTFEYLSSDIQASVKSDNPNDGYFSEINVKSSPSEEEFRSTPMFVPTQWSTNTYDEGQRITIEWMYWPGVYMSQITPDETPKQIQLNSENV